MYLYLFKKKKKILLTFLILKKMILWHMIQDHWNKNDFLNEKNSNAALNN